MKKEKCITLSFSDLSMEENIAIYGGSGFAYDAGRSLRFLAIAAQGAHGASMAIADWIGTTFIEH
ncbi:MAG: hypothetical protein KAT31_03345 [Bacteroidales bacterium]|nr:hypothetical protein [Bacteroidales bacterium]